MKVGSLFSGIGGMDLGCQRAGMEIVFQVENDWQCVEILESRWSSSGCKTSEMQDGTTCHCATCLSVGSPAKTCPLPGSVRVYTENEAVCSSSLFALHPNYVPPGWLSKTYPDYCRVTKGAISQSSSFHWKTQGIGAHGEYWTRNGSESPNDAVVSSLSDILMRDVPERFYLSPKAATGILRRCAKRRRTLPEALRHALTRLATMGGSGQNQVSILSVTPSMPTAEATAESTGKAKRSSNQPQSRARTRRPLLVRRLTPIECERLQGFPEGWTAAGIGNSETP